MKRSSVFFLVALLGLSACASIIGWPGGISPLEFQFRPIVPLRAPGPGGWKGARLVITLMHVTERGVQREVKCPIEVQVPEVNHLGIVTDEFAQLEAASAADVAAERTLRHGGLSAVMCQRFRDEMRDLMGIPVPGARIVRFP